MPNPQWCESYSRVGCDIATNPNPIPFIIAAIAILVIAIVAIRFSNR